MAFLNALLILRALFPKDIKAMSVENTVVREQRGLTMLQPVVMSQEALARAPQRFLDSSAWICPIRYALVQWTRPRAKMQSQFSATRFGPLNMFISVISKQPVAKLTTRV